jgi:microcystin-dependent protein
VLDFAGPNAPAGWLICDGRLVSRTTYSDLFAALGTAWGAGDGSTTFALPNTPGRSSVAPGTVTDSNGNHVAFTFGQITGAALQPIQQTHLPAINLTATSAGLHSHGGASGAAGAHNHTTDQQGSHDHNTGGTGAGTQPGGDHTHAGSLSDLIGDHAHTYQQGGAGTGVAAGTGSTSAQSTSATGIAGAHQHALTIAVSGSHQHALYPDGTHWHTTTGVANHTHTISNDGSHTHLVPTGGIGTPLSVLSPVIVFNKIIYAGQQATTRALAASATIATLHRRQAAPMRGSH